MSYAIHTLLRRRRSRLGPLTTADLGAAAIEYALMAAVIAIGLLSALIATRSSLSSTLGTIASRVSIGAPAAAVTAAATGPVFAGKTLLSRQVASVNGNNTHSYSYSDGSTALFGYNREFGGYFLTTTDPTTGVTTTVANGQRDGNGVLKGGNVIITTSSADGQTYVQAEYTLATHFRGDDMASGMLTTYSTADGYALGRETYVTATNDSFAGSFDQFDLYQANP